MVLRKKSYPFKIIMGAIILLILVAGAVTYYFTFYKEDFNKYLPMTATVNSDETDLENVAYKFWMDLLQPYTGNEVSPWKRLSDVRFNEFQLLAGDENEFAMAVTFWVKLEKKKWSIHNNWGIVQEDGMIKDIQWTFRIKKTGDHEYTLLRIEDTSEAVTGLTPVENKYQKDAGITLPDENNRYQIINDKLEITYNNGDDWQSVPMPLEEFFKDDYSGDKRQLIEGSYVISPEKTAFVIGGSNDLRVLLSTDEGETWQQRSVPTMLPSVRLRILGFTSEQEGYLILTGERTMGFEANVIFKTNDGGKSWTEAGSVQGTNRLMTSGGFINDQLGFISFGSIVENDQPERPSIYRTNDGGENWEELNLPMPTEYKGIFTVAQRPTFDGTQGTLLVNQGPNGDYQGGKVLARFISVDEGKTWNFANLVDPDQIINQ